MKRIDSLLEIMARLRDPEDGCPWDVEQSFATIAPYTIEEAYEVDHAIREGDMPGLCDELGDLLLQVVFHAQMADEAGHFAFPDVVTAICNKLVRRHPHVFGDSGDSGEGAGERQLRSAEDQTRFWEESKRRERAERGETAEARDPFAGIPAALPALSRAQKLHKRASAEKIVEAGAASLDRGESASRLLTAVLEQPGRAQGAKKDRPEARRAVGELLAVCVDLARDLGVDPEQALREINDDFEARARERARGNGA